MARVHMARVHMARVHMPRVHMARLHMARLHMPSGSSAACLAWLVASDWLERGLSGCASAYMCSTSGDRVVSVQ